MKYPIQMWFAFKALSDRCVMLIIRFYQNIVIESLELEDFWVMIGPNLFAESSHLLKQNSLEWFEILKPMWRHWHLKGEKQRKEWLADILQIMWAIFSI